MNNQKHSGTCGYCGEQSDRIFDPPLILPPDWDQVESTGSEAWWHCPGQSYSGKDLYDVVEIGGVPYLRPYESPEKEICWECFNGQLFPAAIPFVANKPAEIQFNGWRAPTWLEPDGCFELKRVTCTECGKAEVINPQLTDWQFIGYDDDAELHKCPSCSVCVSSI